MITDRRLRTALITFYTLILVLLGAMLLFFTFSLFFVFVLNKMENSNLSWSIVHIVLITIFIAIPLVFTLVLKRWLASTEKVATTRTHRHKK